MCSMNVCYVSDRIIILISAYYYVTDFYYTTIIDTINIVWLCQTTINAGFSYSNYIHTFKPRAATLIPRSFSGFLPFTSHKSRTHLKHWCTPIIKSLSKRTIYSNETVLKLRGILLLYLCISSQVGKPERFFPVILKPV